jgi:transposase
MAMPQSRMRGETFSDLLPRIARPFAKRTGRPAERLMARLGLPQSDDTILRQLKRHQAERGEATPARVAGIDDWSWRKGSSYGTIVVDLERREVVDVLADRSAKGTAQWLGQHPGVEIVSRDRCGFYAEGTRRGAPKARQVADRFHLIQNLRQTVEQQLSRAPRPARQPAMKDASTDLIATAGAAATGSNRRWQSTGRSLEKADVLPIEHVRAGQSPARCGQRDPGNRP